VSKRKPRLLRTAQAEEDLIDIWCYIAKDDPRAADRLLDDLDATSHALAVDPGMGMARDDIAAGVRHFPVGRYLILYRELGDGIESGAVHPRHAPLAGFVLIAPPATQMCKTMPHRSLLVGAPVLPVAPTDR
jgi:toxin ParE1/3/4